MKAPLHVRALGLYMAYSLIMGSATTAGLQLALPTIMRDFDVPVTTVVWIMIAYSVALSGGMMTLGVITTYFERRNLIVLGIAVDIALMMLIFVTENIYVFIVARFFSAFFRGFPWLILQVVGIGGFPPEQRGKAVGYGTLAQGLGMMISLPLTGLVMDIAGWRWLFAGSSVVYLFMIPVIYLLLPKLPAERDLAQSKPKFDFAGSLLMMAGLVTLISALQMFARGLGAGQEVLALGLAAGATLAAFVVVELRAQSPVLEFSLFKMPAVALAGSQAVILGFTTGSFLVMLPFLLEEGIGWTAAYVSGVLFFQNLTRPAAGPIAGRLADRFGSGAVLLPAAAVSLVGQVVLAYIGTDPRVQIVAGALLFWGTGQAMMQTVNLRQVYTALPRDRLHLAPSLNLVLTTLGATTGQAFGSLVVQRSGGQTAESLVSGIGDAMLAISVLFLTGMVLTQMLPRLLLRRSAEASSAAARTP